MRSLALPAAILAGTLLLTGCGSDNPSDGGRPVPVEPGGDSSTTTSGTPTTRTPAPTTAATQPTGTTTAPAKPQVVVVPGNYATNPAVQGLVRSYPVYFQALVTKDDTTVRKSFPAFFYADISEGIIEAKRNGWVMRPPGSVVVLGIQSRPNGVVRVRTCRSQTTEYWDPKAKRWTVTAPQGSPQVIDMIQTGVGWLPYRMAPPTGVSCAGVRYPA